MRLKFARSLQQKAVNKLKEAGFTAVLSGKKVKIDVGNMIKVVNMEHEGGINSLVDRLKAMFRPEENIYDEPPDVAIKYKSGQFPEEKLPEGHGDYILPAKAKPNIDRIKQWITTVKLRGKTNEGLVTEYNELKGTNLSDTLNSTQKKQLIDSMAYKISRKIWYVGRKSSSMTDDEWNEMTKNMRPSQGTYGNNDKWNKFPYTKDYIYRSGS
jgi:hypothetical protein